VIGDYLCVRVMSLVIEIDLLFGLFFFLWEFFRKVYAIGK